MAGLYSLLPLIYHERQAEGSMLCAQHALNSLLQGNYFTAPDLSTIAHGLDHLEATYDHGNQGTSTNMDDTGFFSLQVLENALNVWGLRIPRWRSEEMQRYQDRPHTQLAFILNCEQHWYTLRRFGHLSPDTDVDTGAGHWFNLDSSLDQPKWVSKLYLGLVIQQAETDGYSVFAVVQADSALPLALPRTEADDVAATLPEPTSNTTPSSSRFQWEPGPHDIIEGIEDEDLELQAVLHASLADGDPSNTGIPTGSSLVQSGVGSGPSSGSHTPQPIPGEFGTMFGTMPSTSSDPLEASRERNKAMLERMKAEQQWALRDHSGSASQRDNWRARRELEEEEQMRSAIEQSERMARTAAASASGSRGTISANPRLIDADAEMDIDEDEDEDETMSPKKAEAIPHGLRSVFLDDTDASSPTPATQLQNNAGVVATREPEVDTIISYDDEDAELQAALKASLEQVPEGFVMPDLSKSNPISSLRPVALPTTNASTPGEVTPPSPPALSEASTEVTENQSVGDEEVVSIDEMRRRRLARFGN